jgi:branched-chain amino acid transport system substrate-binding protein
VVKRSARERSRAQALVSGAAVVASVVALAACGSSDDNAGTTAGSSTAAPAATTTAATTPAASGGDSAATAKVAVDYVGGTAGAADTSKPPVTIGYINDQGGVAGTPEGSEAAQAAVDYVNGQLGGIDGHPLALKTCLIVSGAEQGQQCAQKMLGDTSVKEVIVGQDAVGGDAIYRTLAGKLPTLVYEPASAASAQADNTYLVTAGIFGSTPGIIQYATQYLHAKSAAVIGATDDPGAVAAVKGIVGGLKGAGVQVGQGGFSTSSSSLVAPLVAAGATKADVVVALVTTPPAVIGAAKALEQLHVDKPVLALSFVLNAGVRKGLGDFPKWTFNFTGINTAVPDPEGEVDAYLAAMQQYAPDAVTYATAPHSFGTVLTATKILNQVGPDATADKVATATKAFTGPTFLMPPNLKYGATPGLPGLGTLQTRFYTYEGADKWTDATDGKWLEPSQAGEGGGA